MRLKTFGLLAILAALAAFPVVCLAQAAGVAVPAEAAPLAAIISIVTSLVGLLTGIMQWLPTGMHTPVNVVITVLGGTLGVLGTLPPGASLTVILVGGVAAVISRFKTKGGWTI